MPTASSSTRPRRPERFRARNQRHFSDGRLTGDLTLYRYTYKDLQVATFHPETLSFLPGNAGKARNQGIEFETAFNVTRDFQLRASMTYSDLKFLEYPGAQCYPGESATLCPEGTQDLSATRYGDGPFTGKVGFRFSHHVTADLIGALDADVSHTMAARPTSATRGLFPRRTPSSMRRCVCTSPPGPGSSTSWDST